MRATIEPLNMAASSKGLTKAEHNPGPAALQGKARPRGAPVIPAVSALIKTTPSIFDKF
jgi:hypothetical protein